MFQEVLDDEYLIPDGSLMKRSGANIVLHIYIGAF